MLYFGNHYPHQNKQNPTVRSVAGLYPYIHQLRHTTIGTLGTVGLLSDEITSATETKVEAQLGIDLTLINAKLEKVVFPLQEYLFESPVEMEETRTVKEHHHHHQRTSLGELFMRAKEEEPMRKVNEVEAKRVLADETSMAK
ncbi:hypothetical protein QJS10_CPB20g00795 [Acorus calamus]|uniref:Uncharacterized protein n=1 Tax=Acorus calamus TaxID=4465 RepID=A0AAV9CBR5_ACOCL|nr:hypothetical protein QJS10_CPB20g00795 [Acorus calamus]